MKWNWSGIVCARERRWSAHSQCGKQTLHYGSILRDSPSTHTTCLPLLFRIPCTHVRATGHVAVCSTVHTDSTLYAKLPRRQMSESIKGGQAEVQAMGDSGMSQQCTQPGDNTETNTIWKPESVTVLFLHLKSTTDHCNQHNETGNGSPTERGNYSDTIAVSPQNAATAKAIRTQHLIMTSCYI